MDIAKTLVVVLHFGSVQDTFECLDSVGNAIASPIDIFLVNNGPDEAVGVELQSRYPKLIYHYAGMQTGFAAGNNIGLRFSLKHGYRYSLLLNNDTIAQEDFLQPLIDIMDRCPEISMAGPAIYRSDDKQQLWSCGGRIYR